MLVTHDMGVIAETADRVAVMYAGRDRRDRAGARRSWLIRIAPLCPGRPDGHRFPRVGPMRSARLAQIEGAMPRLTGDARTAAPSTRAAPSAFDCRMPEPPGRSRCRSQARRRPPARLYAREEAVSMSQATAAATLGVTETPASDPLIKSEGLTQTLSICLQAAAQPGHRTRKPRQQSLRAVHGARFRHSPPARPSALVGESGCGKSTVARK